MHPPKERLPQRTRRAAFALAALATSALGVAVPASAAAHAGSGRHGEQGSRPATLWAAPAGSGRLCERARPCSLDEAVAQALAGDTVIALPGVYHGGVLISKRLTLAGEHAVIDAASAPNGNGVQITGPGGDGSTVEGFVIEQAEFEGILVGTPPVAPTSTDGAPSTSGTPVSDVTIAGNVLVDNGTGFGTDAGQCFSTPDAPGDCGETIHLVSVTRSTVEDNVVRDDVGGILLTDEFGPTADNVIRGNRVIGNTRDCGITLAGHSSDAVNPATLQPTGEAGVFDNLIDGNVVDGNGVEGQGAGVLLGGGAPDSGVYDNAVIGNTAEGNGLAGVAIHQHFAGDLDGNVIEANHLSDDNVDGDDDFVPADTQTTGILVASGPLPGPSLPASEQPGTIAGTVISGNGISDVSVGIWTLGIDPAQTVIAANRFANSVTTPVSRN
jgi:nitrous oxidase accessory protein NosD